MNVGEFSVENKVISWLLVVIMVGGGLIAYDKMGKLEDPAFTIKSAKILTPYPGATAHEVQEELTYHLEDAIQKMPQVKRIKMSVSRPGLSDILIDFKDEYKADDLPNIFDELRRKIADVKPSLPPITKTIFASPASRHLARSRAKSALVIDLPRSSSATIKGGITEAAGLRSSVSINPNDEKPSARPASRASATIDLDGIFCHDYDSMPLQ